LQKLFKIFAEQRLTNPVTLYFIASKFLQKIRLRFCLNALRDRRHLQTVRHVNNSINDCLITFVGDEIFDKGLINFKSINRIAFQVV
jgi:hypothetical protein